jgi:hypothetical protein
MHRCCVGVAFFVGCTHIGESDIAQPQASTPQLRLREDGADIHRSRRAASSEVVSPGREVHRAHREGGGSERSRKDRCIARGSGNGIPGGWCRAKVREVLVANSKRCESCPAGVQHSPSGAGARTAEVVRNHAGGSRLAAHGGGQSSMGVAQAMFMAGPVPGVRKQGVQTRANLH